MPVVPQATVEPGSTSTTTPSTTPTTTPATATTPTTTTTPMTTTTTTTPTTTTTSKTTSSTSSISSTTSYQSYSTTPTHHPGLFILHLDIHPRSRLQSSQLRPRQHPIRAADPKSRLFRLRRLLYIRLELCTPPYFASSDSLVDIFSDRSYLMA
ncbi:hypothetical protein BC826DRAFT_319249 [Russula brevipes]|nr:hypothetical protein BC826DRAFT_319249 [Russula brevipes]